VPSDVTPSRIRSWGRDASLSHDCGNLDKKGRGPQRITSIDVRAFRRVARFRSSRSMMLRGKNGNLYVCANRIIQRGPTAKAGDRRTIRTSANNRTGLNFSSEASPFLCNSLAYRLCRERCRQRRQLLEMDDRQLKDENRRSRKDANRFGKARLKILIHMQP
jgi:hypothetical protein